MWDRRRLFYVKPELVVGWFVREGSSRFIWQKIPHFILHFGANLVFRSWLHTVIRGGLPLLPAAKCVGNKVHAFCNFYQTISSLHERTTVGHCCYMPELMRKGSLGSCSKFTIKFGNKKLNNITWKTLLHSVFV